MLLISMYISSTGWFQKIVREQAEINKVIDKSQNIQMDITVLSDTQKNSPGSKNWTIPYAYTEKCRSKVEPNRDYLHWSRNKVKVAQQIMNQ